MTFYKSSVETLWSPKIDSLLLLIQCVLNSKDYDFLRSLCFHLSVNSFEILLIIAQFSYTTNNYGSIHEGLAIFMIKQSGWSRPITKSNFYLFNVKMALVEKVTDCNQIWVFFLWVFLQFLRRTCLFCFCFKWDK